MKYLFLSMSFFFLWSCQNSKAELDSSKNKDINEIVSAIINQDTLNVLKYDKNARMLCDSLKKTDIYVASKKDLEQGYPPPPGFVTIGSITKMKIRDELFFSQKDSIHIISQYPEIKKLKISEGILSKVKSTSIEKELKKRGNGENYNFYQIGIPLFSIDNTKAYVELGHYCGSLCGHGEAIFLEKINGKWTIIEIYETWMS